MFFYGTPTAAQERARTTEAVNAAKSAELAKQKGQGWRGLAFAFRVRPSVGQEVNLVRNLHLEGAYDPNEIYSVGTTTNFSFSPQIDSILDTDGRERTPQALWRTGGFHVLYATVPTTRTGVNINLDVMSGPWQTVCRVPEPQKPGQFAGQKIRPPNYHYNTVEMNVISGGEVSATMLRGYDEPHVVLRVTAVGKDGVRHSSHSKNSGYGINMASWTKVSASSWDGSPKPEEIREMVLEMRTYQKADWKNVVLRPSRK